MSAHAWTEADLIAVRTAMKRGERSVQFADRAVTYRSVDELRTVEAAILGELAAQNTRPRQHKIVATKGFA